MYYAFAWHRPILGSPNLSIAFHSTVLYNSILRFDDQMLINPHIYSMPGFRAPVIHLRRIPGGPLFDTYVECFERIGLIAGHWTIRMSPRMARIDYLNDPHAPEANSVVPAVSAIVSDDLGQILLIRRTDNNYWSIPGGGLEPGESVRQATAREVMEETGIACEVTGLVGIYSDPNHVAAYDDGEVRQEFSICFITQMTGGTLTTSSESSEVRFVSSDAILDYDMHPSIQLRIRHYLQRGDEPYIG
jgi:ADP-ribose pyrophosphatase YjhB (NUDIX family)